MCRSPSFSFSVAMGSSPKHGIFIPPADECRESQKILLDLPGLPDFMCFKHSSQMELADLGIDDRFLSGSITHKKKFQLFDNYFLRDPLGQPFGKCFFS